MGIIHYGDSIKQWFRSESEFCTLIANSCHNAIVRYLSSSLTLRCATFVATRE